MKQLCTLFCLLVTFSLPAIPVQAVPLASTGTVEVFFSPHGGATEAIVMEIGATGKEILVMAYSLTSGEIKAALVQAKKRGVKVEVILDLAMAEMDSSAAQLGINGIQVFVDTEHFRNHDKIMVLDRKTVITGSFDFTREAEESSIENLLILKDHPTLAAKYLENYTAHREHSKPYIRYSVK
jgi:phosphatidylserine/phosphatidylglycerophosphate/cardiolipin synthase-like enzyme